MPEANRHEGNRQEANRLSQLRCQATIDDLLREIRQFEESRGYGRVGLQLTFENGQVKQGSAKLMLERTR